MGALKSLVLKTGCHIMVSCTRSSSRCITLFNSGWHLEHWNYFCWNGNEKAALPWGLGDWSIIQNIQVVKFFNTLFTTISIFILDIPPRVLGTATEDDWPGVTSLKDYKRTFPKWKKGMVVESVKNLNEEGIDLLQVLNTNSIALTPRFLNQSAIFYFIRNVSSMIRQNEYLPKQP